MFKMWKFVEIITSLDNFFSLIDILLLNLIDLTFFFYFLWTSRYLPPAEGREGVVEVSS